MRTSWSTAGAFLTVGDIFDEAEDVSWPGLVLLDDRDPTDPLVAHEGSQTISFIHEVWLSLECLYDVARYFVVIGAGENVHTHTIEKSSSITS